MKNIAKHLTVQTAGHFVMMSFALASLANVESFFAHLHPGLPALSWGLGIALGIGLVVMAGLLSGMVWDWEDRRFQVVLTVTTGLALLSGGIQAAAYSAHMQSKIASVIVGLSLPVVGELGVALAVSAYQQAMRRQRMNDAQAMLADGVRSQIGEAIAQIDKSKIEAQVNRAASIVTREIVDATIHDMITELQRNREKVALEINTTRGDLTPEPSETTVINTENNDFAQKMTDAKRKKSMERQNALLDILRNEFNGLTADALNKTELGNRLGCTRQTISTDLESLQTSGQLMLNGHVSVVA
jgi:biotin operon repressor